MNIDITGVGILDIKAVFIDYNGTIALNGILINNLLETLNSLTNNFEIFIITGDTFGTVKQTFEGTNFQVITAYSSKEKLKSIKSYGSEYCVAIGNGSIDHLMLEEAALGIAVIGNEGASMKALTHADIVVHNIHDALSLLQYPKKIIATLKE